MSRFKLTLRPVFFNIGIRKTTMLKTNSPQRIAVLLFLLTLMLSNIGCTQEKTYWKAGVFNKVNGEPMMGATPDYIGKMLTDYQYVIKEGNMFHFDYPTKKDIKIDTLKSFSYHRFEKDGKNEGKLTDSIYEIGISGVLQIKFNFEGTSADDKRFVLKFEPLTEAQYHKEIAEEFAYVKEEKKAFDDFIKQYKVAADWKTASSARNKDHKWSDAIGDIEVSFPGDFMVKEDRGLTKRTFDKIKAGTLAENNETYLLPLIADSSNFNAAQFIVAKAPESDFNLQRYIAGKPTDFRVAEQDANGFHAVELAYDYDKKSVAIKNYISFKHVFKKGIHFFYISENEIDSESTMGKELAKKHYILMKNFSVIN